MTFRTVDLEEHDASRRQLERDRLADCPEWKPLSVDERRDAGAGRRCSSGGPRRHGDSSRR